MLSRLHSGTDWDGTMLRLYGPGYRQYWHPTRFLSVRPGPRMRIPGRDYIVYAGAIEDALLWRRKYQMPQFWWPRDHTWAVAGDADLPWSVVAGSPELIDH